MESSFPRQRESRLSVAFQARFWLRAFARMIHSGLADDLKCDLTIFELKPKFQKMDGVLAQNLALVLLGNFCTPCHGLGHLSWL